MKGDGCRRNSQRVRELRWARATREKCFDMGFDRRKIEQIDQVFQIPIGSVRVAIDTGQIAGRLELSLLGFRAFL